MSEHASLQHFPRSPQAPAAAAAGPRHAALQQLHVSLNAGAAARIGRPVVQGKWIMRHGSRVEVPGDYVLDAANGEAADQGEAMLATPASSLSPPLDMPSSVSSSAPAPANPEQLASAAFMSDKLSTPIDVDRTHAIPQKIHRFWSGRPMSKEALENLLESAQKTKNTNWEHNLWSSVWLETKMECEGLISDDEREKRQEQLDALQKAGYKIRRIEELCEHLVPAGSEENKSSSAPRPSASSLVAELASLSRRIMSGFSSPSPAPVREEVQRTPGKLTLEDVRKMAELAVDQLKPKDNPSYEGIKYMSDMARLMYLQAEGGHHFDVDMGLGSMDFKRQYYHNDPEGLVPLMGSVAVSASDQDTAEALDWLGTPATRNFDNPVIAASAAHVTEQAATSSAMLNGMIATRPDNPNVTCAIEQLRKWNIDEGVLSSGMGVSSRLLYGNVKLNDAELNKKMNLSVPPYLLDLKHLTTESENR